jgi:serine/threonine protein kinase
VYTAGIHPSRRSRSRWDTAYAPPSVVQLFNDERLLVGRLEHIHLARMLDEGTTSTGALYLTMEHIDALSITEFAKLQSLPRPACIELILQLCSALEYLHSKGFVHRDLRPENILVSACGKLKIVDFKSTSPIEAPVGAPSQDTAEIWLHGKDYASPEVCQGGSCTRAADVYSMGILLHELVTGIRPASPSTRSIRVLKPTGSPELDQIISRAVRTDPAERFRSAAEFAQRLQRLL